MKAEQVNPAERWQAMSAWYAEFAAERGWAFLSPVVALTDWVSRQEFAAALYPNTSHLSLCVSTHRGYNPAAPFFSCSFRRNGRFVFEYWSQVGTCVERSTCYSAEVQPIFAQFSQRLTGVA